ncbi:NAD(P)/FAD-dependent oxidoreductase [Amycolatopsis azurea]|uniref:FAD-dependent oxidoreductase n=1 Tax=Amycolatopsis azurea DSM 43854 TaxID=1238180 RepID=M2NLI8_9PSEU|nr:FAD-dependent oxidoreductase [Amycolatopsis azurea]EMD23009.1 FAD dependent oxidoreductase [Amycolatopsis azurea DSM 43854]OOC08138.1 FAD-dependent oxidoreductase [Amycolatopsis azurea DSM 43854]
MATADVVIVGAGVVGASVAYHLTQLGHDRVTVLDARDRAALPGSTGLAPGFVGQLSATPELAALATDSVATYRELSSVAPTPLFWQVGCLEIATGPARLEQARHDVEHGRRLGIEAHVLDAADAIALAPALVDAERTLGALHIPSDGAADPVALTHALVDAAEQGGATFRWSTPVRALEADRGRVVGVRAGEDGGLLRADRVVLAAGIWGPVLAADVGVRLPMVAVEHPYVFTAEVAALDDIPLDAPIVRYPEQAIYTRRHGRRYGLGTYSHAPLPMFPTPALKSAERPFRETHFGAAVAEAAALVPAFRETALGRQLNGVFALTPDELPLVGPATEMPGLWFAEASWVTHAGGVGRQLANLLLETGDQLVPPERLAPDRFADRSDHWIRETALSNYRGIYDAH